MNLNKILLLIISTIFLNSCADYKTDRITQKKEKIYHFDFYRIKDEGEAFDLGYEEYFFSSAFCFVEWPEKVPNLIEDNMVKIFMHTEKEKRVIEVKI